VRRKDREMNREFGLQVIDKARFGVLSLLARADEPYGIPLSIARAENTLYFHSAQEGKKVELFKKNPKVSVAFVGDVNIPENFTEEELREIVKDESKIVVLLRSVFTTEFESAIVTGRVESVENEEEKVEAMRLICQKYTPTKMPYFAPAIRAGLSRANVYKVEIEEITAKRKKYDEHGEEMKWGRLE